MIKKYYIAVLFLVAIILAVAVFIIFLTKPLENNVNINNVETTTQTWRLYSNEKFGYSIEFPNGWHFQPISVDSEFQQQGPNKYNIFAGQWYVTPKDPGQYDITNLPTNPFEVDFKIYQTDPNITFPQFFSNLQIDLAKAKQEVLEINGMPVSRLFLTSVDTNTGKTGEYRDVYFKHRDKMFVISYHGYPVSDEDRAVAERMIYSLRPLLQ